jgi:thiol-disulfide isomerase/thioredoxin
MRILTTLLLIALFASGCKTVQKKNPEVSSEADNQKNTQTVNFSEQSTWLLGYFTLNRLYAEPHSSWFVKGYDSYNPKEEAITILKEMPLSGITIKIVLGTWCPDSRREVPRFFRVLDAINFPKEKVELIGTDDSKFSPIENFEALNISRVPTFIIFRNNIEAGRIIENPVTSLEQDMQDILSRNE